MTDIPHAVPAQTVNAGNASAPPVVVPTNNAPTVVSTSNGTPFISSTSSNGVTVTTVSNTAGTPTIAQNAAFINEYDTHRVMARPFPEKTDIQLQARVSANSYVVSIGAEGYLIQNARIRFSTGS